MLTVRGLVVEVGGKRIVDGVSLQVRPGEKVGLVGRNGAGKTTLLRVLGGADRPRAGLVERPDAHRLPLAGSPERRRPRRHHRPRARALGAGARRSPGPHREAADRARGEPLEREHRPLQRGAGGVRGCGRLRGGGRGAQARRRSRPARRPARPPPRRAVRRRAAASASWCASSSAGASCSCSTSRPTTSTPTPATWLLKFLRSYRGALLVVSHDLDLLDEAITRVVHIDREAEEGTGTLVEYKGTYSQYLAAREGDHERAAKLAERQTREIARLKVQAGAMRGQTAKRARVAQEPRPASRQARGRLVQNTAKRQARSRCASRNRRRRAAPCSPPPSCTSRSARSTCSPT